MQNYLNKGSLEAGKKSVFQSKIPIQKRAEKPNASRNDHDPLTNITCKIGDNACSAKHSSVIRRSGLFNPINENGKVQSLLRLQKNYGNRFVQKVINQHTIQAKLRIGQPGDVYEKEADRVADTVMHMPQPAEQSQPEGGDKITPLVQRQVEEGEEEEEKPIQAKKLSSHHSQVTSDLETRINALRSGGSPLTESVRSFFEPRFGYNFGDVRVHNNSESNMLNQNLNAKAFTVGKNIMFKAGEYNPHTPSGLKLLAHELTHTIHQAGRRQKKEDKGR